MAVIDRTILVVGFTVLDRYQKFKIRDNCLRKLEKENPRPFRLDPDAARSFEELDTDSTFDWDGREIVQGNCSEPNRHTPSHG